MDARGVLALAWLTTAAALLAPRRQLRQPMAMAATEVVQFTRDLRVNDHGGLRAVADPARGVEAWAPVYVGRDTTEPAVARALGELDAELEARYGARLAVVDGDPERDLARVCDAAGASVVHVCADDPCSKPSRASTARALEAAGLDVAEWTAPLRAPAGRVDSFDDYRSTLGDALEAHDAPASMPASVDIGFATPPPEARAGAASSAPWSEASLACCGLRSAKDALDAYLGQGRAAFANARLSGQKAKTTNSLYAASLAWIVGDGAPADRLAFREPAERAFSEPLALGCLSMREVRGAAARAGALSLATTKGKGWPTVFFRSETALLDVVEWKEFHRLVATTLEGDRGEGATWFRWEGHLCRYLTLRDDAADGTRPALVLVHGFGASADQWRRLERALPASADGGPAKVLAVDILGFGLSAKPGVSYTQHLWEQYIADFLAMVAPGPGDRVVVAGNSIGGGLCSGVAANSDKVAGLVLCNSAGVILDDAKPDELDVKAETLRGDLEPYGGPPQAALDAFGEAVIAGLWPKIPELLVKYYDNNPANADAALVAAISRDALDPGAANVIGSGAKLPPQRSLNEDFEAYRGPILVPQGAYDGVTGPDLAQKRARDLETIRPGIDVTLLDAGHCPHDETPDLVADAVAAWWPKAEAFAAEAS